MSRLVRVLASGGLSLGVLLLFDVPAQAAGAPLITPRTMASAAGTVYIASSASSLGIFLLLTAIVAGGLFLHAVDTGKTAL